MGRWSLVVMIVAAVATACGDNLAGPDPSDGATSGTRLKLRYYDFGNVRQLAGVRDTQRDENCTPAEWANGKAYCVPASTGSAVYADAACTQLVGEMYVQPGCTSLPPAYFVDYEYQACDYKATHLYPRGAKIAGTGFYAKNQDGSCSGPNTGPNFELYALGPEIAVTDLAEIKVTSPSMTGRLGQRHYESADGLRFPVADRLRDGLLGGDCDLRSDTPGSDTGTCVPTDLGGLYQFSDAACTQQQITVGSACPAPKVAAKYGVCLDDPTHYYALASQLTPTTVYYQSGMTCSPMPASPSERYYDIGAELTLAQISRTRGTGTGRLQPIHFTTPEGLLHRDSSLFDSQIGVECAARTQADGSVVCVPRSGQAQTATYYTDVGCTSAVDVIQLYRRYETCSSPPAPSYALTFTETASCDSTIEVHHVGAELTGALYRKDGTTCVAVTTTSFVRYRLADVLPLSELAAGTLVTEP